MIRAGITGNIGSGKSLVAKIFEILRYPVFKADEAGREALNDPHVIKEVLKIFGNGILDNEGSIIRSKLASVVFTDPDLLNKLNNIVHPAVRIAYDKWLKEQDAEVCLYEAAILFESGYAERLDTIICITAPLELRCSRVVKRDNISEDEFYAREARQMDQDKKAAMSDWVIQNDETCPLLPRVIEVYNELRKMI